MRKAKVVSLCNSEKSYICEELEEGATQWSEYFKGELVISYEDLHSFEHYLKCFSKGKNDVWLMTIINEKKIKRNI